MRFKTKKKSCIFARSMLFINRKCVTSHKIDNLVVFLLRGSLQRWITWFWSHDMSAERIANSETLTNTDLTKMKMWLMVVCLVPCVLVTVAQKGSVKCDDGEQCPDLTTCCKLARAGEYGCCPMPSAVCCSDHIHCCPGGSKCDVSKGTCLKADSVLRFLSFGESPTVQESPAGKIASKISEDRPVIVSNMERGVPMEEFRPEGNECPDGETECPPTSTCCKLKSGRYGCCEGANSVCCSDGLHCCPQEYTCDEQHQMCTSASRGLSFRWFDKKPVLAWPIVKLAANLTCADKKTTCLQNDTCCNATQGYGCCPFSHAVCCLDRQHCCPASFRCDVPHQRCYREDGLEEVWVDRRRPDTSPAGKVTDVVSPTAIKQSAAVTLMDIECPDGSTCPSGSTCCQTASGPYGCCPLESAVCCTDGVHCCPQGYQCDLAAGNCTKSVLEHTSATKIQPTATFDRLADTRHSSVTCPDGSECPDNNTCCRMRSSQYGCCGLPNAVCCSDYIHCCPNSYKCDLQQQRCTKESDFIPWSEKQPALQRPPLMTSNASVVCPGGQIQCSTGATCCKLSTGEYGCCPLPNAVCCSDGIHCCPEGYTCVVASGQCTKGEQSLSWVQKQPAQERPKPAGKYSVECNDSQTECPDGNSCCKLSTGQYGCCPLPQAVCCSDGVHCCPENYTCDETAGQCKKGGFAVEWVEKRPALLRMPALKESSVVCPDGQSECQDGQTCCKLASGQYGCCPLPEAVCCADQVHCCPNGYSCDISSGRCSKGQETVPWVEKQLALQRMPALKESSVVCPGGQSECQDGQTCCKLASGQYGCCPLPEAVCCADLVHCCPNGYTCDTSTGRCLQGQETVPWVEKQLALQSMPAVKEASVTCPNGQSQCQDGQTCCLLRSGQYGCCPMPEAVCCHDKAHCCPNGFKCDGSSGSCTKGQFTVPWEQKQPAIQRNVGNVVCPDKKSECPDGQTCCQLTSEDWGCCPQPNAVCCADKLHCCPNGYTCDPASGECSKGLVSIAWEEKQPALPRMP